MTENGSRMTEDGGRRTELPGFSWSGIASEGAQAYALHFLLSGIRYPSSVIRLLSSVLRCICSLCHKVLNFRSKFHSLNCTMQSPSRERKMVRPFLNSIFNSETS